MTSSEIRQSFLDFFASKNHRIVQSAPVIPHGDPTLLFTNAGMNQFKEVFLGAGKRDYTRAADTQKCIRVSGKHNDLEEVGRDTYHHTFFEMLGNWSFGDYYKKEAIQWAWELLTSVWKLPKDRLWATVYKSDDEAFTLWNSMTDIDPSHILRFGEKENFWEMGETGPCGPCSEIHFDLTPRGDASAAMVNAGTPDLIEIWNLVFIQNNRKENGELEELPAKHVDTGMGFERVCAVMASMKSEFKFSSSNYETDVFLPVIHAIGKAVHREYKSSFNETDTAFRVIADHVRALTFAIADGAIPSNEGRGYVLRRILRRAARFGRKLGGHEPFIYSIVSTLADTMGGAFPEIREHQSHVERVIKGEEEAFNQTLDRGLEIFETTVKNLNKSKVFPGEEAFKLYDTFGFPLDLTELLCKERGFSVDTAAFVSLMEKQRDRSRESGKSAGFSSGFSLSQPDGAIPDTQFVGYDTLETDSTVVGFHDGYIALDRTPFYAESGGQVGDKGKLQIQSAIVEITDTKKDGGLVWHQIHDAAIKLENVPVHASVDKNRRLSIMRNHSATHLIHSALRKILGAHVHQSGSYVADDHLRFDFAHFSKVSPEEISAIEETVNGIIKEDIRLLHHRSIPFAEAQKMGALMFFGDKYGDVVNVVQFGKYSAEFCGGTHVPHAGEIGFFKIRSEASIASGIRRIEAVTGSFALDYLKLQFQSYHERLNHGRQLLDEIKGLLNGMHQKTDDHSLRAAAAELHALDHLPSAPERIIADEMAGAFSLYYRQWHALENLLLMLSDKKRSAEKEFSRYKVAAAGTQIAALVSSAFETGGFKIVASRITTDSMDSLKALGDSLRSSLQSGVGFLAAELDGKAALVCVVTDDLIKTKNLQAGKIVGAIAKILGGGGGGKAHLATAGGKDTAKIDEALTKVSEVVQSFIH